MARYCIIVLAATSMACDGVTGTLSIQVVTAPDSRVLQSAKRFRLTLTSPATTIEVDAADGLPRLSVDIEASRGSTIIVLEGIDESGAVVAVGETPAVPTAAVSGSISMYVAPPMSVRAAPVPLAPARSDVAVTQASLGAWIAGGRSGSGEPTTDVALYNVYFHDLEAGPPLPAPRAAMAAAADNRGTLTLVGGTDAEGNDTADTWRLDSTASNPEFDILLTDSSFARSRERAVGLNNSNVLVTGSPMIVVDGIGSRVSSVQDETAASGTVATYETQMESEIAIAGEQANGVTIFANNTSRIVANAPADSRRHNHAAVTIEDTMLLLGGAIAGTPVVNALRYRFADGSFEVVDNVLTTARLDAAVAYTRGLIVVAGGRDEMGNALASADILNADTLGVEAILALAGPRTGASAVTLANGQVLIVGGVDANGEPIGILELFTPRAR